MFVLLTSSGKDISQFYITQRFLSPLKPIRFIVLRIHKLNPWKNHVYNLIAALMRLENFIPMNLILL